MEKYLSVVVAKVVYRFSPIVGINPVPCLVLKQPTQTVDVGDETTPSIHLGRYHAGV